MISEIATIASRAIRRKVSGIVTKIVLRVAACLAGLVAIGFLTGAGYMRLEDLWGGPAAALAVAIFWFVAAGVLAVSAAYAGSEQRKGPTTGEEIRAAIPGIIAILGSRAAGPSEPPSSERACDTAERPSHRIGPVQMIGAALFAGFLLGRIVDRNLSK